MHNDRPGTQFSLVFCTEGDLFFTRAAFIQGNVAYKSQAISQLMEEVPLNNDILIILSELINQNKTCLGHN